MSKRTFSFILVSAFLIAVLAGFYASSHHDGLEKVAKTLGFENKAKSSPGIFIDYQLPAFPTGAISTIIAGIFGIILIIYIFRSLSKVEYIGKVIKKLLNIK